MIYIYIFLYIVSVYIFGMVAALCGAFKSAQPSDILMCIIWPVTLVCFLLDCLYELFCWLCEWAYNKRN